MSSRFACLYSVIEMRIYITLDSMPYIYGGLYSMTFTGDKVVLRLSCQLVLNIVRPQTGQKIPRLYSKFLGKLMTLCVVFTSMVMQ